MIAKTKDEDVESDKLREARDRLVLAAIKWRKVDAGEIGIKRLLLQVNALADAVDDYEKVRNNK